MNELVIMKNQQALTTSLQVAQGFEKRHKDVLEAIKNKIDSAENSAQYKKMFIEGTYQDASGKNNKLYYMNRDGFTFIAMGFTGRKADNFKLEYINAFNQMENHIKQQATITNDLSPQLQFMNSIVQQLTNQELTNKRIENKVDNISELIQLDTKDWRKKVNTILKKISAQLGGYDKYKEIGNESYQILENRAKCNLNIRLENRRKNMIVQGLGKTTVKKLNKLDIIGEDTRLIEIYLSVVKDMAIKHQINVNEIF